MITIKLTRGGMVAGVGMALAVIAGGVADFIDNDRHTKVYVFGDNKSAK